MLVGDIFGGNGSGLRIKWISKNGRKEQMSVGGDESNVYFAGILYFPLISSLVLNNIHEYFTRLFIKKSSAPKGLVLQKAITYILIP